ncbi:MAG: hypothetical protein B6U87_02390 [Candidatus Aenigmarchaeota archaeon ex4484_52]|nr:MAG: hypothetical protein B6U87_02390 [Candidatus Aenigmarchaeota archaeon ex4484_52]
MKALLVIDMQREFITGIYNKENIIFHIQGLIKCFQKQKQLIVFTQDYHTSPKDKEFIKFGKHCIKKTEGVKIIDELINYEHILIRKKRFSAFFNTKLNKILLKHKIKEIFISGIYTEYCILATALDSYYNNYNVYVISDATSTSNYEIHKNSISLIKKLSANILTTNSVIKQLNKEKNI